MEPTAPASPGTSATFLSDMFSGAGSTPTPSTQPSSTPAPSTPVASPTPARNPSAPQAAPPPGTPSVQPAQPRSVPPPRTPMSPNERRMEQQIDAAAPPVVPPPTQDPVVGDGGLTQPTDPVTAPAAVAPLASMTPDQLRALVQGTIEGVTPRPVAPTKSREQVIQEFNTEFQITRPSVDDIVRLHQGGDGAVEVLMAREAAVMRSAALMAKALVAQGVAEMTGSVEPMKQFMFAAQEARMREDFLNENKDLAQYPQLLEEIGEDAKARVKAGMLQPFKTEKEAKDFVANRARALLKLVPGAAQPANGTNPTTNPTQTTTRRMTPTSAGGQGSAGGGATAASLPEKIFGS